MSPEDVKTKKILNAVRTLLATKGYAGTTISLVAAEAGVSRGLLHYYFKNKEEMLATAIRENMEISISMIHEIFRNNKTPEGYARGITGLLRGVMENDPDFFHLFFEGFAVARQSKVVGSELESLYGRFRKALESCLEQAGQEEIIQPELPVPGLAAIITGLIDGMGLQLLTEPDLVKDDEIWNSIETAIVDLLKK
mgnify:CR=1 FL=1